MSWWRRTVHRLTASTEELESEDRLREAVASGAAPIASVEVRQRVVIAGRIREVRLATVRRSKRFEAEVDDGTGTVTLVFLGRRAVDGVVPGAHLKATGRLCDLDGKKAIFNPRYELLTCR
ncbi:OB-fold nucleic acid binding domain-containing protein [Enemella sp. A6]|uniref:OB-fold nucleic acid binding domain-containing protein n=1 Tax=Enemella sp. A6 TaxID=3440152 RepID=UPI003EBBED4F